MIFLWLKIMIYQIYLFHIVILQKTIDFLDGTNVDYHYSNNDAVLSYLKGDFKI